MGCFEGADCEKIMLGSYGWQFWIGLQFTDGHKIGLICIARFHKNSIGSDFLKTDFKAFDFSFLPQCVCECPNVIILFGVHFTSLSLLYGLRMHPLAPAEGLG